jgi:CubicO group peptidase (beta-lactamase class C family)
MGVLDDIAGWPVVQAAAGVTDPTTTREVAGDPDWRVRIASITKAMVAYAGLIAVEEGSLRLDQPAGPPGSTVRHLLAHAAGYPFNGRHTLMLPGRRRIYSNTGFDVFGELLASATGMSVAEYLQAGVFQPLGMERSELRGSPAYGAHSTIDDLLRFGRELLRPTLVSVATRDEAITEQFPGLSGVIPGLGRYDPNPWGLGVELKGAKRPHWTAPHGSPRTFGHFGGSGTFLWVDPDARLACAVITNREFGSWAPPLWSALSERVLAAFGDTPTP